MFSYLRLRLRWVGEGGGAEELLISYSCSCNNCLLYSVASQVPGTVTVTVKGMTGNFLGETSFDYVDEVENVLQMLLRNRRLQARYFLLLAQELGNRSLSDPTDHLKEDKQPSEHFSSEKPGITLVQASFGLTLVIRVSSNSRQSLFSLAALCVCLFTEPGATAHLLLLRTEPHSLSRFFSLPFFHAKFIIQSIRCLLQS